MHSGVLAPTKKPKDANAEAESQKPADTKVGGY